MSYLIKSGIPTIEYLTSFLLSTESLVTEINEKIDSYTLLYQDTKEIKYLQIINNLNAMLRTQKKCIIKANSMINNISNI